MVELLQEHDQKTPRHAAMLVEEGELAVVVDDSPEIVLLLSHFLAAHNLDVLHATNADDLYRLLETRPVALLMLDIGLPDKNGVEILKEIVPRYPDLGIIMVTGSIDLDTALDCLRLGADDYLAKPVTMEAFNRTLLSTLQKRRLAKDNRLFQRELQATSNRTQFLHQLNLQMNTVYLSNVELKGILRAILVGITSEEGLGFNRAFLALFSDDNKTLQGKLAIGTTCREEAGRVWESIKSKKLHLGDLFDSIHKGSTTEDVAVNEIARKIAIPVSDRNHILIAAAVSRQPIAVINGVAEGYHVPQELLQIFDHSSFVAVPLFSPSKSLGVIIVDNFVTHKQISREDIDALELFASQASLAIEHSHLYEDMRQKIEELEVVNQELDRSKDLLVAAEKYSAIGHMAAQLVHVIRNPITSIGGTARLLAKKNTDEYVANFLNVITKEAAKVESTLEDLFSFVEETELEIGPQPLYPLISKSVMVFYTAMKNGGISYSLDLPGDSPVILVDRKKIRQIFLHLVKNAIEAMPDGGRLEVRCRNCPDGSITTTFKDSGGGIIDAHMQYVEDPFFTTKTYGTGMGLTLVSKIATMHGAKFTLEHNPAGGMIAEITFPPELIDQNTKGELP